MSRCAISAKWRSRPDRVELRTRTEEDIGSSSYICYSGIEAERDRIEVVVKVAIRLTEVVHSQQHLVAYSLGYLVIPNNSIVLSMCGNIVVVPDHLRA